MFISSADLMTRNLNRRVEIACPVHDPQLKKQLRWLLATQLRDTAKASLMLYDGSYIRKRSAAPFDSQAYFMEQSPHIPAVENAADKGIRERIRNFFRRKAKV